MKINDLAGKTIRISARTITALNNEGKTAGMVTGVETFYKMSTRDKFEFFSRAKQAEIKSWDKLFRVNGIWYFIIDDAAKKRAKDFERIDGRGPIERLEQAEKAARSFGATVIHVERAYDTREI